MASSESVVLHTGGLYRASEKAVVEAALGRLPGVSAVESNPVAQIANVTFDPDQVSVAQLRRAVEHCGFDCAGQSMPGCICDPLAEPHHETHDEAAAAVPTMPTVMATAATPEPERTTTAVPTTTATAASANEMSRSPATWKAYAR